MMPKPLRIVTVGVEKIKEKLAIHGGAPIRKGTLSPWDIWPEFSTAEFLSLKEIFVSTSWLGTEKIEEFTAVFTKYLGVRHGVAVNSGTTALEIAVAACGISLGDEVILPSYTFYSDAAAILKSGGKPVFVDIRLEDLCIDPETVESAITDRTKAVLAVHLGGNPVDMDKITNICRKHHLILIEDVAHAVGGEWRGKKLGSFGDLGCFTFHASKSLTAGEGGFISTNNEKLFSICQSLTDVGRVSGRPFFQHFSLGGNYRMTKFQAAVLLIQLKKLDRQIQRKEENISLLLRLLVDIPGIRLFQRSPEVTRLNYFWFGFLYDKTEFGGIDKDHFIEMLNLEGIPVSGGYSCPLYEQPVFNSGHKLIPEYFPKDSRLANLSYGNLNHKNVIRICHEAVGVDHPFLLGKKQDMEAISRALKKIHNHFS